MTLNLVMKLFNLWPPFLFSGISIKEYDLDEAKIIVQLKTSPWNANYFGTHFGGSLQSMCDPFYSLLLTHKLGKKYFVWDIESRIKFHKATKEKVFATFHVNKDQLENLIKQASHGEKVEFTFSNGIIDKDKTLIAEVFQTVYVRLKPEFRKKEISNS